MHEKSPFLMKVELLQSIPDDFPFYHLYPLHFKKNITVIVGENGVGKSTILEALAVKFGCPAEGGSINFNFSTEDTHLDYTKHLRIAKNGKKIKDIFFYRSETFYTFLSEMRRLDNEPEGGSRINTYYGGRDLHTVSHGESMIALYSHRFKEQSLYFLDEPEASLSIANQINLVERILQLSQQGTQFIIATHSPVIMAIPDATLLQITQNSQYETTFSETNHYYLLKELINSKGDFLRHILNS
ncbi:AAA family ATPase [Acinetobacter sp. CFCC 10889]|uniref:AAA family ATPase n=1 Tax=Acinetobacter sp. CFCC 10889 TaxID=1775557 RepID=UPI000DD0448B|nr:AAA family ATPase [Acinetobacter sp. CFCC 10889]